MTQSLEQFGATIKKKYPQYNDIPDIELGQKMLSKYPQYKDMVGQSAQIKEPLIEKVGNFIGITPLAKGISSMIFKNLTNVGRDLEQKIKNNTASKEELQTYSEIYGNLPNAKQIIGGAAKTALTLGTLGTGSVASQFGLKGAGALGARVAEGGIIGGAFTALDNIQKNKKATENILTGVAVGGAMPLAGAAIKKGVQMTGKVLQKGGEKIQQSLIKPSISDIEDGFKIETLNKYKLGGSLDQTLQKTQTKLQELTNQLNTKLQSRTDVVIDLNKVAQEATNNILKDKTKLFGNSAGIKRVLNNLANEIEDVSANGLVDLPEAQLIKQASGQKGAWVYGFVDPDAKATEMVYTKFYRALRQEIEKKAPEGIREINKQISELIPISHAVIRRIPVAAKNNVFSLTDIIAGGITLANPKALGLFAANRLTKSGQFGKLLSQFGENVSKITPKGNIGERVFGK
jgi:gas vesicle protein